MSNSWIVDMRHYLDEQTDDLPESPARAGRERRPLLWVDRRPGNGPPAGGRLAHERPLPAESRSPTLSGRHHGRIGP